MHRALLHLHAVRPALRQAPLCDHAGRNVRQSVSAVLLEVFVIAPARSPRRVREERRVRIHIAIAARPV